jgi:DNA-binding transcriptional LysR family regulator
MATPVAEPSGPDLEEVAAFLRVAEAGSFTAASRRLGLPKSTISRRVARLEEKLGVQLLHRTTRSLALTEAGTVFHERAALALAGLEEATMAVRESQETPRGHLRVTAPYDLSEALGSLVVAFVARFPAVTVELMLTDERLDLVAENIDLALRGASVMPDSSLVARRMATMKFTLMASPSYLRRHGKPKSPADLGEHALLMMKTTQGRSKLRLQGAGGEQEVAVRTALAANDFSVLRAAALAGAGIALLPDAQSAAEHRTGRLVRVLPDYTAGEGGLWVMHPASRLLPAKARAFQEFVLEHIAVLTQGHAPPKPLERARVRCAVKARGRARAGARK